VSISIGLLVAALVWISWIGLAAATLAFATGALGGAPN
jgi:hypothetical protein